MPVIETILSMLMEGAQLTAPMGEELANSLRTVEGFSHDKLEYSQHLCSSAVDSLVQASRILNFNLVKDMRWQSLDPAEMYLTSRPPSDSPWPTTLSGDRLGRLSFKISQC